MVSALDGYIGAFLVGTFFNVFLTGVSWIQTFEYIAFCSVQKERTTYKWTVALLQIVGMVHTITSIVTIYNMVVTGFGNAEKLAHCPWSFALDPVLTAIIAFIVQFFFAYRIWIVGKRAWFIPAIVSVLTVVQLAVGVYLTHFAFTHTEWAVIGVDAKWAVALWLFLMAATDVVITGALVIYLNRAKTAFERTNSVIDRLLKHIITNNALTMVASIASSILFIAAPGVWHVIPGLVISRLYIISLQASLNSRSKLAEDLDQTQGNRNGAYSNGGQSIANMTQTMMAAREKHLGRTNRSPSRSPPIHQTGSHSSTKDYGVDSVHIPIQVTVESTSDEYTAEKREVWDSDKASAYSTPHHKKEDPTASTERRNTPPFSNVALAVPRSESPASQLRFADEP